MKLNFFLQHPSVSKSYTFPLLPHHISPPFLANTCLQQTRFFPVPTTRSWECLDHAVHLHHVGMVPRAWLSSSSPAMQLSASDPLRTIPE